MEGHISFIITIRMRQVKYMEHNEEKCLENVILTGHIGENNKYPP